MIKQLKIKAKTPVTVCSLNQTCQHLNKETNFKEMCCKDRIGLNQLRIADIVAFCIKLKFHTSLDSVLSLILDVSRCKFAVKGQLFSNCLTLQAML